LAVCVVFLLFFFLLTRRKLRLNYRVYTRQGGRGKLGQQTSGRGEGDTWVGSKPQRLWRLNAPKQRTSSFVHQAVYSAHYIYTVTSSLCNCNMLCERGDLVCEKLLHSLIAIIAGGKKRRTPRIHRTSRRKKQWELIWQRTSQKKRPDGCVSLSPQTVHQLLLEHQSLYKVFTIFPLLTSISSS
jgi:hypothetical protein